MPACLEVAPRRQPLSRQPRTDAGRVSRLSGTRGAPLGRRTRNDDDALGHATAYRRVTRQRRMT